jgi:hypothetical protein
MIFIYRNLTFTTMEADVASSKKKIQKKPSENFRWAFFIFCS